MATVSVRIEDTLLHQLAAVEKVWHADRSEVVRRFLAQALQEWRIEHYMGKVREKKLSVGKAAEECHLSLWEMLELLKEKQIDWAGYEEEDLQRDLALLK